MMLVRFFTYSARYKIAQNRFLLFIRNLWVSLFLFIFGLLKKKCDINRFWFPFVYVRERERDRMRATSSRQYTQVIFSLSLWCSGCRGISPFILVSSRQAAAVHLYLDLLFSDSLFGNSDTVFLFLSVYISVGALGLGNAWFFSKRGKKGHHHRRR
jgi:hypothetical protein